MMPAASVGAAWCREYCFASPPLPVVYEATVSHSYAEAIDYLRGRKRELFTALHHYGAILLRGFSITTAREFQNAVEVFVPKLANYQGGDSPRLAVTEKIYTSTSYPAALPIALHNEMSYTREYPSLVAFYCEQPPESDGETPLADCRRVLHALPKALVEKLARKRLRYVQNLAAHAGIGKSWPHTFETSDRARVEAILRARGAELEWRANGALRIVEVVDPIVTHPRTGERVFFSQAHMWHVSSLDAKTRRALLKLTSEDDLYHHCTFGDGSPISDEDLAEMRRALDAAKIQFAWHKHDLLLVDNILVAHARNPFQGERRVLVAMG